MYFTGHGDYEIFDYYTAIEEGKIPEDYYVFWGYEDEKLFEYAKEEVLELASQGEPFNFTLLTVDTHFEDGYVCELCGDEYEDQYANVIACSSSQISEFVSWLQEQDFYEDTTVVINGDHPTMDSDFCEDVSDDYTRRTYTAILNSSAETVRDEARDYTTLDLFPTTLAALGCTIEGDRLGLGTNLYSDTDTLLEEYGMDYMNEELEKKSDFLEELGDVNMYDKDLIAKTNLLDVETYSTTEESGDVLHVSLTGVENLGTAEELTVTIRKPLTWLSKHLKFLRGKTATAVMTQNADGSYTADLDLSGLDDTGIGVLKITCVGDDGETHLIYKKSRCYTDILGQYEDDFDQYLTALTELDATKDLTIFTAVGGYTDRTNLKDSTVSLLDGLGIIDAEEGKARRAYYCVASGGETLAMDQAKNEVSATGTLPNGTVYEILSQTKNKKYNDASIILDGVEYSLNNLGYNFVVYDNETQTVISEAAFRMNQSKGYADTWPDVTFAYGSSASGDATVSADVTTTSGDATATSDTLHICVSGMERIESPNNTGDVYFYIWDADTLDSPEMIMLTKTEIGEDIYTYDGSVNLEGYDLDTLYIAGYAKKNGGSVIWHDRMKVE